MPVTPLHMGPGLLFKGAAGRHFSLMVFGFSQVLIDIEPGIRFLRGDGTLHGFTHTYLGATLIAVAAVLIGRPVCQFLLRYWNPDPASAVLNWLPAPKVIPWPAAITGAFVGSYSHVLIDSLMHADMEPFAPLWDQNALLHVISVDALHVFCMLSAVLGLMLLFAVSRLRR
jgi:hypothetical protein